MERDYVENKITKKGGKNMRKEKERQRHRDKIEIR
jgi:hypothetical protein